MSPKKQEWQRRWIGQNREQGGLWSAEDYQLFQRRYFAEDQSGGEFVKHLEDGLKELQSDDPTKYIIVNLSDKEAKKTALQRAVSGMLKADWVVLRDLWFEDEDSSGVFDSDELGPEGDSLWSRILSGVGLFEEMKEADQALKRLEQDMVKAFPKVDLKTPITDVERDTDDDQLQELKDKLAEVQQETQPTGFIGIGTNQIRLQAAIKALTENIEQKQKFRADWKTAVFNNQQAIESYLNSFPDE